MAGNINAGLEAPAGGKIALPGAPRVSRVTMQEFGRVDQRLFAGLRHEFRVEFDKVHDFYRLVGRARGPFGECREVQYCCGGLDGREEVRAAAEHLDRRFTHDLEYEQAVFDAVQEMKPGGRVPVSLADFTREFGVPASWLRP